jgi:death-on-curing protein
MQADLESGMPACSSQLSRCLRRQWEEYLHGDLFEMAAAYLFHIVKNHPFVDGNKRTGTVAALVFLAVNGVEFEVDDDALVDLVTSVAKGGARKHNVAAFLRRCAKGA